MLTISSNFSVLYFLTNLSPLILFFKVKDKFKIYLFSSLFLLMTCLIPFVVNFEELWSLWLEESNFSDPRYLLLNILIKLIPNIYFFSFIMQLISGLLIIFVVKSLFKENRAKDNLDQKKFYYYVFIFLNYLIILLSKMYIYHIRQYWSCALFIFLFYVISKTKVPKKKFIIKSFSLTLIGVSIHLANIPSFIIINLIILNKYLRRRIKILNYKFKSNIEYKYLLLTVFLFLLFIFTNYFEPIFIFLVNYLSPKQFAQGYLIPGALGVSPYEKSSLGFILPLLFLFPILIMTNTVPFSNLIVFINKKKEMVFNNINFLSAIIIFVSLIEYFSDFYSIGRMKTIIYPFVFYILFNVPLNQIKLSNLKLASLLVFALSMLTSLSVINLA